MAERVDWTVSSDRSHRECPVQPSPRRLIGLRGSSAAIAATYCRCWFSVTHGRPDPRDRSPSTSRLRAVLTGGADSRWWSRHLTNHQLDQGTRHETNRVIARSPRSSMLGSAPAPQMQMPHGHGRPSYGELGYTLLKIDARWHQRSSRRAARHRRLRRAPDACRDGGHAGRRRQRGRQVRHRSAACRAAFEAKVDYMYGIWVKPKYCTGRPSSSPASAGPTPRCELSRTGVAGATGSETTTTSPGASARTSASTRTGTSALDWMRYSNQSGYQGRRLDAERRLALVVLATRPARHASAA